MTPKEKAKQLYSKMENSIEGLEGKEWYDSAKQCALIAVDEILNFDVRAKSEPQFVIERRIDEYWQEVKQEIEKL